MKKILSTIALLAAFMFVGGVAQAAVITTPDGQPVAPAPLPPMLGFYPLETLDGIKIGDPLPPGTEFVPYVSTPAPTSPPVFTTLEQVPAPALALAPEPAYTASAWVDPGLYAESANVTAQVPAEAVYPECSADVGNGWCYLDGVLVMQTVEPAPVDPAPVAEATEPAATDATPAPEFAAEQTTERTELAYTGVGQNVTLATVALILGLAGVALVRRSLRMKREANG